MGSLHRTMAVQVMTTTALFGKKAAAPAKKGTVKSKAPPPKRKATPAKKAAPKKSSGGPAPLGLGIPTVDDAKGFFNLDGGKSTAAKLEAQARSGSQAKGAQRYIGYRGSGQVGSAPQVDAQGNPAKFGGVVYRLGSKYGGGIDEYAPIFTPEERSSTGDTYAGGPLALLVWAAGLASLLGVGGYAIYATSALS